MSCHCNGDCPCRAACELPDAELRSLVDEIGAWIKFAGIALASTFAAALAAGFYLS